jgi:hypothetical protein
MQSAGAVRCGELSVMASSLGGGRSCRLYHATTSMTAVSNLALKNRELS